MSKMTKKKYPITCCRDCPESYELHIKKCIWCLEIDQKIENPDIIHPDCSLEDY